MKRTIYTYLLAALVLFSALDLNGYLSAVLFFVIAGLLWLVDKSSKVLIPPVAFVIVAYAMGFPMMIIWPDLYSMLLSQVSPYVLEYAMLWAVRGFGAFAFGYVLVGYFGKGMRIRSWQGGGFYIGRICYLHYVLTSIGWLAMMSWVASVIFFGISLAFIEGKGVGIDTGAGTLQQILTLLANLRYPFFFGFLLLRFWKQTDRHLSFLFIGLLLISSVEIITVGSKGSIIRVMVVVLLALTFLPVKLNLKQIIAGALAIIAVYGSFAVITEYRSIMQKELHSGGDVFNFSVQAEAFRAAMVASLPFSESASDRRTVVSQEDVLSRFGAGMLSFANLMKFTGRHPPYEHAWESFLVPIYSIAPRALIPEKPEFFNSGRNAREFYGWAYGGISVTLLGSLYFAWGYAGIIFGMAFLGGLLAYMVRQVRLFGLYSTHWLILLVVLMVPILDVGETFQALTTGIIRVAVILWLLHIFYPMAPGFLRRRNAGMMSMIRHKSSS